jgi:hypothetical protein
MKKLPNHENTPEKQAAAEYQHRFYQNHKIGHVLIMLAVLFLFGALMYWFKNSGILFSL